MEGRGVRVEGSVEMRCNAMRRDINMYIIRKFMHSYSPSSFRTIIT